MSAESAGGAPEPRNRDRRLIGAFDDVASGHVSVLSVTVLDVLLHPTAPDRGAVLLAVGEELRANGVLAAGVEPERFALLRARAQEREGTGASLESVHASLPAWLFAGPDAAARAPQAELDAMRELVLCDLDVLALIMAARERGIRVLALGPGGLTEAQLRQLIDQPPLQPDHVDGVVVAGGPAAVVAAAGVGADEILHIGPESDVAAARALGTRGVALERPAALDRVLAREARHGPSRPPRDGGLTAVRAKVAHHRHDRSFPADLAIYWEFGATVVGPALAGFAEWVQERAHEEGVRLVHCPMREGELLTRLLPGAGPVAAERIWLSRQVVSRANIVHGSREELLPAATTRRRPPTVRSFCRTVGVDLESSRLLADHADGRLSDPRLAGEVIDVLSGDPALRGQIVASSAALRRRLVDYVEARRAAGGGGPLVLVDLGWGGTIQGELERALRREEVRGEVVGLYLITHDTAVARILDGSRMHGYLAELGIPETEVTAILRSPEFLEQLCMPAHGSQIDLAPDLTPVLDAWSEPPGQAEQRAAVQEGVIAFQREWSRHRRAMPHRIGSLASGAAPQLLPMLSRAVSEPTFEEARALGSWMHDENFGSAASESLVAAGPVAAVRYMDPATLLAVPMTDLYWPYGVAALHDEHLAAALALAATRRLQPEAFSSIVETGDFSVYYDHGHGFDPEWKQSVTPRRNRHGLSLVRVTVGAGDISRVQIEPAQAACVLRIDWLTLRCWVEDAADPVEIRLDTPERLSTLSLRNCSWLTPRALLVPGPGPQLGLDLTSRVERRVHRVDVECGFAALAVSPAAAAAPPALRSAARGHIDRGKRLLRDLENRTGVPIAAPLRTAWRRRRGR